MTDESTTLQVGRAFLSEAARLIELDLFPRLRSGVERLTEEEIWWRPNPSSNSVGNLMLHLEGNVRQWIISGVGGQPDLRCRSEEFSEQGPVSREKLVRLLEKTVSEAVTRIRELEERELTVVRHIQAYDVSALQAIFHVVEHFSHHTGQILYIVKMLKGIDLGFYKL